MYNSVNVFFVFVGDLIIACSRFVNVRMMFDIVIVCVGCGFSFFGNFILYFLIVFVVNLCLFFLNLIFINFCWCFGEVFFGVVASSSRVASFGLIFLKYDLMFSFGLNCVVCVFGVVDVFGNVCVDVVVFGVFVDVCVCGVVLLFLLMYMMWILLFLLLVLCGDVILCGFRL